MLGFAARHGCRATAAKTACSYYGLLGERGKYQTNSRKTVPLLLPLALLLYFNEKRPSLLRTLLARYTNSINLKLQPRLGLQIRAALSPAAIFSSPP
jgi:hypothetical protein